MKPLLLGLIAILGSLVPATAHAQEDYVLLAPLPGLESSEVLNEGGDPVEKYFTTIYQIGVSLVLLIAVVMLIFGGIQYMTSDSIGGKGGGRETIGKALIGILLAAGSYLLLFLIGGADSVRVGFDLPGMGYLAPPVDETNQVCTVRYAQSSDQTPPVGQTLNLMPRCACDTSSNLDCLGGGVEIDVAHLNIQKPIPLWCVDHAPSSIVKMDQSVITSGPCDGPSSIDVPATGSEEERPVATAEADDPRITIDFYAAAFGDKVSIGYVINWTPLEEDESASVVLELYQQSAVGGEFDKRIASFPKGDINDKEDDKKEVGGETIDATTLEQPTIAWLKIYTPGGELIEEAVYGFNGISVTNPGDE